MRLFHSMRLPAIVALLTVCAMPARAAEVELPSAIANCANWQDARKQNLLAACGRHIGCALMLKSKNTCPAAQDFVGKLEKTLAGRNEISNETVFHAAMPKLTQSKMMASMITETRNSLADQRKIQTEGSRTYRNDAGEITYYYEGGVKDEMRHGVGIMIGSSGITRYGLFVENAHTGRGWVYTPKGTMFVGSFSNNAPHGEIAFQDTNGAQIIGQMVNTNWNGIVHAITLNGTSHTKSFYDDNGKQIGRPFPGDTPDQTVILAANADRKQAQLEQQRGDKAEALGMLSNALTAAAGGKTSRERLQLAAGALSGGQESSQNAQGAGSSSGGLAMSGAGRLVSPPEGSCERLSFTLTPGKDATWAAQTCAKFTYEQKRGGYLSITPQNVCNCNVVGYVKGNWGHQEIYLKPFQRGVGTTEHESSFAPGKQIKPVVIASCDRAGDNAIPGYDEKTNTCRARACHFDGTCMESKGVAR